MEKSVDKEQQWQYMAQRVAKITDRLGKEVDNGIRDLVIVLNLLEIHTSGSCEGHLQWGTNAPWVDIKAPGLHEEEQRYFAAMQEAQRLHAERKLPAGDVDQYFTNAHRLRREVKQKHLEERRKVLSYLVLFYQARSVPYDRQLIVHGFGLGTSRLESLGADFQEVTPLEIRQQKLQEYQEEMQAFTSFLREIWLDQRLL